MTPEQRLWSNVSPEPNSGCWLWTGSNPGGYDYGHFRLHGRQEQAHRAAYMLLVGPIPDGLTLDHRCKVKGCVNPAHLEPVTQSVNAKRGSQHTGKTHCPHGHPYTPENTYYRPDRYQRLCRTCKRARSNVGRSGGP